MPTQRKYMLNGHCVDSNKYETCNFHHFMLYNEKKGRCIFHMPIVFGFLLMIGVTCSLSLIVSFCALLI